MKKEIKTLLIEVSLFKKYIVIVGLTGMAYAISYSRLALIIKSLFDYLSASQHAELLKLIPVAFGLAAIAAVSRYFHLYLMNYVAECVVQNLRQKLQQKFMNLNLSFHNTYTNGSGGLISRILNDMKIIQDGLRVVADIFLHPLLFVFLLGNLFYLDWKLTLFTLLVLPLVATILRSVAKSLRKYLPYERDEMEKMTSTIKESLDGVRVIQSFNLENHMAQKLINFGQKYLGFRKIIYSRSELSGPSSELIATGVVLGVLYYVSYQISLGLTTPGMFMGFLTSLMMLNQPIKKLQETFVRIQEVVISVQRVNFILENNEVVSDSENGGLFPQQWQQIRFKDVSFAYGQDLVLNKFNLTIRRGEKIALVGASGSGKSTVVNLLERFFDPISGAIEIDQVSIDKIKLKDLRKNISLVNQDVFLFSDTIENNIRSGNWDRNKLDVQKVAELANAHGFISKLTEQYQSRVGERGSLLSGGEKQRISIARALFKDAPILILDEATSALDNQSEVEVQKGLDHLLEGRTAIIVAHRLSTIKNADKIVLLKKGQVVEMGSHDELISLKGEYYQLLENKD